MQRHMQNRGDHRTVERPGAGSSGIHAADRPLQAPKRQPLLSQMLEQRQHTSPKVHEAKDGAEMMRGKTGGENPQLQSPKKCLKPEVE